MAGDWIKMRLDLAEDPAVIEMADELGVREETVVGYCHAFWCWASRQCHDGRVTGVTLTSLGRVLSLPGFPEILVKVGWLKYQESGLKPVLEIPHFERHLSESAKTRALAANRKSRQRVPKMSRTERDKTGTREEKRREESLPPIVPRGGLPVSDGFDEWWQSYPSHRQGSRQKAVAAYADAQTLVSQESLLAALRAYAASDSGKGKFCLGAVRWLEERRWEDNPASWQNMDGNGHAPTGRVVNDAGRLAEKKHAAAVRRLKARGVEVTDAAVKKELSKDAPA